MVTEVGKLTPREQMGKITGPIAQKLHVLCPDLSPNHVTVLGVLGSSLSLWLNQYAIEKDNKQLRVLAASGYLTASLFDALDGALAREIENNGGSHNREIGQLVDAGADRVAENIAALVRMLQAKNQQDAFGIVSAGLNGITNFLPSLLRAAAESHGKKVPETGRDLLELLGTRAGRLANVAVGNFLPEVRGISLAKWFDLLATVGNLKTSINRFNISQNNSIPITISQESQQAALDRLKILKILTALGVVTIGTVGYLSLKTAKKN